MNTDLRITKLQRFVVVDEDKCVGCKACELACYFAHSRMERNVSLTVGTVTSPVMPKLFVTKECGKSMPIQCRHCEDAPCLNVCEYGAIDRTEVGIIINHEKCSGCKDCIMACPFGAIELYPMFEDGEKIDKLDTEETRMAAYKCDLCMDRPEGPICVEACPHHALRLVTIEDDTDEKLVKAAGNAQKARGFRVD